MSQRLKSDVRRVERHESGHDRQRDDDKSRSNDDAYELHRSERRDERHHHTDHSSRQRRRRRNDDETLERHTRRRHYDAHSANGASKLDKENDSEMGKPTEEAEDEKYMKAKRAKVEDTLTTRTGGAYIPPARLKMMQVC